MYYSLKSKISEYTTIMVASILRYLDFMNTELKPSKQCGDLILKFEGYRPMPYICPAGYLTVGIGLRIPDRAAFLKKYPEGIPLSNAQADLMKFLTKIAVEAIVLLVKVELNQNQFDALLSFIYNVGVDAFKKSSLLRLINEGKLEDAAKEFRKWNKATVNGKLVSLAGLTRRRTAEELMFEGKEWRTV